MVGGFIDTTNGKKGTTLIVLTKLAELPPDALLDEAALADALSLSTRSIRNLVDRRELPEPFQLCGKRWRAGTVCEFLTERQNEAIEARAHEAAHEQRLLSSVPSGRRRRAR